MVLAYVHYSTVNRVLALFYFGLRPEVRAMKNNIIRDGSKDGFQVMILKMKNIIEKANANKTAICFYPAVCVGNAIRFASSGYAAFFVFSSKGENRYSSFL